MWNVSLLLPSHILTPRPLATTWSPKHYDPMRQIYPQRREKLPFLFPLNYCASCPSGIFMPFEKLPSLFQLVPRLPVCRYRVESTFNKWLSRQLQSPSSYELVEVLWSLTPSYPLPELREGPSLPPLSLRVPLPLRFTFTPSRILEDYLLPWTVATCLIETSAYSLSSLITRREERDCSPCSAIDHFTHSTSLSRVGED